MSEIIQVLPPEPRKALVALAMFRFLTPAQFVRLGVAASEPVVRDYVLSHLEKRKRPLAKSKKIGTFLPHVHYLTQHGAEELARNYRVPVEEFPYPIGAVQFGEIFARHRFAQVDFHIGVRQWAHRRGDASILFADMDFDVTGSRRHGDLEERSRIKFKGGDDFIIADGIFGVQIGDASLVYVLEVHRATETTRVARQIAKYIEVIRNREIMFKYRVNVSPLICSVHTKERVLKGTKAHLLNQPGFEAFKPAFLFNTSEQLDRDFTQGWHFADEQPAYPFEPSASPVEGALIE